jgi:hypothetical protein
LEMLEITVWWGCGGSLYGGDHVEGVARVAAVGADGDVDGVGAGHEAQAAEHVEADGGLRPVLPGPPICWVCARRQRGNDGARGLLGVWRRAGDSGFSLKKNAREQL